MNQYQHALQAVQRGWVIFPTIPRDKPSHPRIGEWGKLTALLAGQPLEARRQIAHSWWTQWPDANIAVACKPSGLLVIDCDLPKTPEQNEGIEEYIQICQDSGGEPDDLFDTHIVTTGSGGLHFYYQWPPKWLAKKAKLGNSTNVDIRCNNGTDGNYVLGAGSITDKGAYTIENDIDPKPVPSWLKILVRLGDKFDQPPPPRPSSTSSGGGGGIDGLIRSVAEAPEGNRNDTLNWAAHRARTQDGVTLEQALEQLGPAARKAGLGDKETEATIRSAYRGRR